MSTVRNKATRTIEALFPADAEYIDTVEIGQKLLDQAKSEMQGWRTEPTEILIRYAELCVEREKR